MIPIEDKWEILRLSENLKLLTARVAKLEASKISSNAVLAESLPFKKCGEGDNVCNCKDASECGYL